MSHHRHRREYDPIEGRKLKPAELDKYRQTIAAVYPLSSVITGWDVNGHVKLICTLDSTVAYMMGETADAYIFTAAGYADVTLKKG